ncbi:9347_t:CDS:2 [Funneliformis mosseae]|uniref:9347_t:CDS:1 n=1 Tax=Funneliformis mosseae TaxID=27381 RepID=A0A9N9C3M0_FUNMO|nr:9347_t:CDS:2 [Funneliformis mosseae]
MTISYLNIFAYFVAEFSEQAFQSRAYEDELHILVSHLQTCQMLHEATFVSTFLKQALISLLIEFEFKKFSRNNLS